MAAEALKKAGSADSTKFRDAFRAIKDFPGATGLTYTVQPTGDTVRELLLIKILDGFKMEVVDRVSL